MHSWGHFCDRDPGLNLLEKTAPQNKCSIVNDDNLELCMPEQIVPEFRKEFQTRLTERKIHPAYKNIERLVNEIFAVS